jgi:hypothetical protein
MNKLEKAARRGLMPGQLEVIYLQHIKRASCPFEFRDESLLARICLHFCHIEDGTVILPR